MPLRVDPNAEPVLESRSSSSTSCLTWNGMQMNFLPQPISTFMVNSDFRGIILWAVLFVLTYLIYLPFFKVYEKQELESEQEVNTLRKEETNG